MSEVIVQGGAACFVLLMCSFLIGHFITIWLRMEFTKCRSVTLGFTALVALFEVIAIPCIMTEQKFSVLIAIYGVIVVVGLLAAIVFFVKNTQWKKYPFAIKQLRKPAFWIVAVLIFGQMFLSSYLCHTDADDAYFVAISNMAVENNQICLDGDLAYNGMLIEENPSFRPEVAAWELFVALIAGIFSIHPAILVHTVMPFVLIALCYMAVFELAGKFTKNKDKLMMFMVVYALFNLFGGYSIYSSGCFLLLRIWQGKAMLVNYAFPVFLSSCIEVYQKRDLWRNWIWNVIIVIAGMAFTVVGLYLMPIYYVVAGIPYIAKKAVKKDGKRCGQVCLRAFLTMLPVILFDVYVFVRVMTSKTGQSYSQTATVSWDSVFEMTMGQGCCFVLFLGALLYLFVQKSKSWITLVFCGMTVALFVTFLNPLLCGMVSGYVTGADVYWRLYWILPVYLTVSYVLADVIVRVNGLRRYVSLAMSVLIIALSGTYMYKEGLYFAGHGNRYKIPEEVIAVSQTLLEKEEQPVCLFPEDIAYYVRQYSSDIAVVKARGMSYSEETIKNTDKEMQWLYDRIYNQYNLGATEVIEILEMLEVDYVYMRVDFGAVAGKKPVENFGYLYHVSSMKTE